MSTSNLPSQNEKPLLRSRALYLGTSIFTVNKKEDEQNIKLEILQNSIAERYPIDGSSYSKGVETWLSIFVNGIQMEHATASDIPSISALFYYPIKSLLYCGALRFVSDRSNKDSWKFIPLTNELADTKDNAVNPSLFVMLLKGIDPSSKKDIIETNLFVVGTKEISLNLVESCQQAYNKSQISRNDFYKKYGNIPVVFCLKDDLSKKKDKRVVVKHFDLNGYFYATENTEIDLWQLFEDDEENESDNSLNEIYTDLIKEDYNKTTPQYINPYEKSENLISVDKRVDPQTGQSIYVRYLAVNNEPSLKNNQLDNKKIKPEKKPPILIREERTPSPIVYERYIKSKAPQVIIKEIHVEEEAPPVKYIQKKSKKSKKGEEVNKNLDSTEQIPKPSKKEKIKEVIHKPKSSLKKKESPDSNIHYSQERLGPRSQKVEESKPVPPLRRLANKMSPHRNRSSTRSPQRPKEPVYTGIEHIKPPSSQYTKHSSRNIAPSPNIGPPQNMGPPSSMGPPPNNMNNDEIQYKPYNPYAAYYNYNGVPSIRRNPNSYSRGLEPNYSGRDIYESQNSKNPYSSPRDIYGSHRRGHYQRHANEQIRSNERYRSPDDKYRYKHYDEMDRHNERQVYDDRFRYDERRDNSSRYDRNQRGNNEPLMDKRGKKVYLIDETELDQLKDKLTGSSKSKKIIFVDENEVELIKKKISMAKPNAHIKEKSYHSSYPSSQRRDRSRY